MRFAYVLAWKREDGTRIPETQAGLEEHKALVAKYEEETGPLKPAYRGIIDRKYAKVAKKLAEREVGRARRARDGPIPRSDGRSSPRASTSGATPMAQKFHRRPLASRGTWLLSLHTRSCLARHPFSIR